MNDAEKPFGNKLVVVTGAGSGIGRATALGFAANGARIVAADLDLAAAESVSDLITARGGTAHARQADVSAAADMERFANWVRTEVGVPDVVVNNAGIAIVGPLLAHTEEDWQRIIGVNLLGVVRGCRLFGAQMAERGTGGHRGDGHLPGFHQHPYRPRRPVCGPPRRGGGTGAREHRPCPAPPPVPAGEGRPRGDARGAARPAGGPGERRGQGDLRAVQGRSGGVARAGQARGRAVAGAARPGWPMTPCTRPRHGILEVAGVLQGL